MIRKYAIRYSYWENGVGSGCLQGCEAEAAFTAEDAITQFKLREPRLHAIQSIEPIEKSQRYCDSCGAPNRV